MLSVQPFFQFVHNRSAFRLPDLEAFFNGFVFDPSLYGVERLDHVQHLSWFADFSLWYALLFGDGVQSFLEFSAGVRHAANQFNLWLLAAQGFVGS